MSRIGNKIITLPAGVEFTQDNGVVTVKGPKGELTREFPTAIEIRVEGTEVTLHRPNDSKEMKTIHGTSRANLNNMVVGVSEGFKKELEMRGVGYRAQLAGNKLTLAVGKSHPDEVVAPEGITFEVPTPTQIVVSGINKEVVGQTAAYIRSLRAPEPTKVKVFVMLVNSFAAKKVKQVNNKLLRWLCHLADYFSNCFERNRIIH